MTTVEQYEKNVIEDLQGLLKPVILAMREINLANLNLNIKGSNFHVILDWEPRQTRIDIPFTEGKK